MTRFFMLCGLLLLLGGCSDVGSSLFGDEGFEGTPTLHIQFKDDPTAQYTSAHGLVALVRATTQAELNRNLKFCEAMKTLATSSSRRIDAAEVPTFWTDARARATGAAAMADDLSCADLIKHYDYSVAAGRIAAANIHCHCIVGSGPALLAFANSNTLIFAIDLSQVDDAYRLKKIASIWRDQTAQKAALWDKNAFRIELLRSQYMQFANAILFIKAYQ